MSVLVETTLGAFVVDLAVEGCPLASENFLKLCQAGAYNGVLFFRVTSGFVAQTGDRTGRGHEGESFKGGYFKDEISPHIGHRRKGTIGMAHTRGKQHENGSQWYVTLRSRLGSQLDEKFTSFGVVERDEDDVLGQLDSLLVDAGERPLQDVRIVSCVVLHDPFPASVNPLKYVLVNGRPKEERVTPRPSLQNSSRAVLDSSPRMAEKSGSASSALTLEVLGDLPSVDAKPPENVLFVCKLNAATKSDALRLIFARFGEILSCEIVRDSVTGESLQYGFIEFEDRASCEEAFLKMNNVLIDDRRIKVDFSQSIGKTWRSWSSSWRKMKRSKLRVTT